MGKANKIRVMAFGTFDYLHAGHESYISQAAKLGDELIVVIARDRTSQSIRGFRPHHLEKKRLKTVSDLPDVTKAVLGEHEDKYKVIRKWKPDIIALGYDQFVFTQNLNKIIIGLGLATRIIRLTPYAPQIYKSSLIRGRNTETTKIASTIN